MFWLPNYLVLELRENTFRKDINYDKCGVSWQYSTVAYFGQMGVWLLCFWLLSFGLFLC